MAKSLGFTTAPEATRRQARHASLNARLDPHQASPRGRPRGLEPRDDYAAFGVLLAEWVVDHIVFGRHSAQKRLCLGARWLKADRVITLVGFLSF